MGRRRQIQTDNPADEQAQLQESIRMPNPADEIIQRVAQIDDLNELKRVYVATQGRLEHLGARRKKQPHVNWLVRAYLVLSPYVFCAAVIVPVAIWFYRQSAIRSILRRGFSEDLIVAGVYGAITCVVILVCGRVLRSLVRVKEK